MTDVARGLLARADVTLSNPSPATAGNTARLSAFLARQAVEDLVEERCEQLCGVTVAGATMKAKLAVLKSLDTTPAGSVLVAAWHQLTGHCHQHAYQLSPTTVEVRAECEAVARECFG